MNGNESDEALAHAWLNAAQDADVRAALENIYAHVAREIEARGPACWASGRCCNFDAAGHRLYATGLETAYTLVRAQETALLAVSMGDVADARARGGCPYQRRNLCTAHAIKPLGCRVYFCDRSAQDWQRTLHEAALADVRALHERCAVPYRYMEWRAALEMIVPAMG